MEQKQVKLIGLRVQNNGIIQAAELTPDLLQHRLVLVTGNIGNGKSTLLNAAKIATAGTDAIKKSDALPEGFIAEALLQDGEVPIYIGVKTRTLTKGDNAGHVKMETYLYTKDANGKAVQPIIDGVAWTAAQYWKALTTELTHSFSDVFSENQTTHRKLIEKLFKPELDALKADEVVERIVKARKERDSARALCEANGAFMSTFEEEGYKEQVLQNLQKIDIKALEAKIQAAIIEKDRLVHSPEAAYQLECNKLDQAKERELQRIKDEGRQLREELTNAQRAAEEKYLDAKNRYQQAEEQKKSLTEEYAELRKNVSNFIAYPIDSERRNEQGKVFVYAGNDAQIAIMNNLDIVFGERMAQIPAIKEPLEEEFVADAKLQEKLSAKLEEYAKVEKSPVQYPERVQPDTSDIDAKISQLQATKDGAEVNNSIWTRYNLWLSWIEAKGKYEKEVDTLRKLYASINTGVDGLKIVPQETESGKVEVWLKYNGQYDPAYFGNEKKEMRYMFDYSSFQSTIIGLMLQAARLNLKKKALRLAYVDNVAFCKTDVDMMSKVAEELDLKLVVAWTHEAEKDSLMDGQVLVDGGEIFFNE